MNGNEGGKERDRRKHRSRRSIWNVYMITRARACCVTLRHLKSL